LHIHFASALADTNPGAAKMLSQAALNTDIVSAMTYALVVEKQDPAEFAKNWVAENSDLVDSWLN
jgi:glycine betaine/proline transport system substrate-binding protein